MSRDFAPLYRIVIYTSQTNLDAFSALIEDMCETVSFVEIEDENAAWDSEHWFIEGHMTGDMMRQRYRHMQMTHALSFVAQDRDPLAYSAEPCEEEVLQGVRTDLNVKSTLLSHSLGVPAPQIIVERLKETNWLEDMWEKFPAQHIEPFFIHSSFHKGAIPQDAIPLKLDAATAFGSGEHGTTAGCLKAIYAISKVREKDASDVKDDGKKRAWRSFLDLGCGSGILGIAAAKLCAAPVTAIDNDKEAVRVTQNNAALNAVEIQAVHLEGLDGHTQRYDVVAANILAKPLIYMAPSVVHATHPQGHIILSGLLDWQRDDVLKAYTDQGVVLEKEIHEKRWVTLILKK